MEMGFKWWILSASGGSALAAVQYSALSFLRKARVIISIPRESRNICSIPEVMRKRLPFPSDVTRGFGAGDRSNEMHPQSQQLQHIYAHTENDGMSWPCVNGQTIRN